MISIIVNGEPREIRAGATLAELIEELGMKVEYVAAEVNRQLVPRGQRVHHQLNQGDQVELVTLVGGGALS